MHKFSYSTAIKYINVWLFLAVVFITGCATIFTGTSDTITFNSNADPVRVYIGGRNVGTTPLTIEVNRQTQKGPLVRFVKKGYETQEFNLEQQFNWVSVLDVSSILTSGGIDVFTGAIMEYSPKKYHVEMLDTRQTNNNDRMRQIEFAKFVLLNAQNIQKDIATGGGEYSDTLATIIGPPSPNNKYFKNWVSNNKERLASTSSPEQLLTTLRTSHVTP